VIFGIGTDIVRVTRMQRNLDRFGERFAERILTPAELDDFHGTQGKAHFLAKRFAAKEAAAKAMGTGFAQGVSMRHIGVTHESGGRPLLEFEGAALVFLQSRGIDEIHISLADEEDHAVAFVTLGCSVGRNG
jgi:holo-[acyl-carrier protein] synthase